MEKMERVGDLLAKLVPKWLTAHKLPIVQKESNWAPFVIHANDFKGLIDSRAKWNAVISEIFSHDKDWGGGLPKSPAEKERALLNKAKEALAEAGDFPVFTLYTYDYTKELLGETLEEFFRQNGMVASYELDQQPQFQIPQHG